MDPTRLLDQPDLPEREREALEAGQRQPPVAYDTAQGAARLGRALNAPSGTVISTSSVAAKLGLKMLVTAVLCTIGFFVSMEMTTPHAEQVSATSAPPIMARMPQPEPPVVETPRPVAAVAPSAPQPAAAPSAAPHREAPRATPAPRPAVVRKAELEAKPLEPSEVANEVANEVATPEPPAPAPAPEQQQPQPRPLEAIADEAPAPSAAMLEMKAIARAKRALSDDEPAQALAILAGVARDFPRGYLIEERRALHVLALAASGESDRARREAASFLRDYPSSAFTDRVKAAAR